MELNSSHNEASNAQRSDEGQSQPPDTNTTAATMQQMMQQMINQISELMARVEKVEKKETTATTASAAPAIPTPTPAANTNYTYKLKELKNPNAFNSTRS